MDQLTVASPLGPLTLLAEGEAITGLVFGTGRGRRDSPLLLKAAAQLEAYFARKRRDFQLPLAPRGGQFEQTVWRALCEIPYGVTVTYGHLAKQIDGVARAVGQACGANPIPIIIPCHRVVAADGSGGFSAPGGLDTKYKLLSLEGAALL